MIPSPETGGRERRFTPRTKVSVPVALRPVVDSSLSERQIESLNMSYLGMYFASTEDIPEGTKIEMRFEMPAEITGKQDYAWRCMGRVVRVDREGQPEGKFGIGVQFDYYELLAT
ncbi:MAG TPA: PilZ domain-containing protein [Candidatus Acidoferrales bacterium]|nr:PilZ domain-containing protein [Candidatus Acidoferrales bacterium]